MIASAPNPHQINLNLFCQANPVAPSTFRRQEAFIEDPVPAAIMDVDREPEGKKREPGGTGGKKRKTLDSEDTTEPTGQEPGAMPEAGPTAGPEAGPTAGPEAGPTAGPEPKATAGTKKLGQSEGQRRPRTSPLSWLPISRKNEKT